MSSRYFTNSIVRRDQEQYAVKLKMPKGSLKELKRAYLDVNFYNLPEIRALSKKFGKISPLALTQIYCAMSAGEGAKIDEDAIADILESNDLKNVEEFITYCLDKSLFKLYRENSPDNQEEPGSKTRLPDNDYEDPNIERNSPPLDFSHIADAEERKRYEVADSLLVPTTDKAIQRSNQFLNAGRRPMREWAEIWLSVPELVTVMKEFTNCGIRGDHRKLVFERVAARIRGKVAEGMQADRAPAFNWLTGFELTDTLRQIKAQMQVKREQSYAR